MNRNIKGMKWTYLRWCRCLIILIPLFYSIQSWGDTEVSIAKQTVQQEKKDPTIADKHQEPPAEPKVVLSAFEEKFMTLEKLQSDYNQIVTDFQVKGDKGNQDVFRKQAFDSNNKIRDEIDRLIDTITTEEGRIKLLSFVRIQIDSISKGTLFINSLLSTLENSFQTEKPEDQSSVLNKIEDNQNMSLILLRDEWEDQKWLNQLGEPDPNALQSVKKDVLDRLAFAASSLLNNSANRNQNNDLQRSAIDSEKPRLLLLGSIAQRRVNIDNEQLKILIQLATEMRLDTTEYKRILFESTTQFTNDLFDIRVLKSLAIAWTERTKSWLMVNGVSVLLQILVIIAIVWGGGKFGRVIEKAMTIWLRAPHLRLSRLMQAFLSKMSGRIIFFIALLFALSQIGINLAPLLTGLGVAGIVVGFALQDTLSNFASGVMLLIYRPFDVNDYVQAGGVSGKVSHMNLVNTTIKTFDNQIIIVPNKMIWGGIITNITHERVRRVDMTFSIGYKDNIELAEQIFNDILDEHEAILSQPERIIQLHVLGPSSLDFIVRPWVKTDDYWPVFWFVTREVKRRFDAAGINIPYPQQDVHLHVTKEYEPDKNEQLETYFKKFPKSKEEG